ALAGELGDLAGQPTPLAGWVRIRAVPIAYVAVGVALVPFAAYWRAPAVGALVYFGMTALLAVLVARRARSARAAEAYQGATLGTILAGLAAAVIVASGVDARRPAALWLAAAFAAVAAWSAVRWLDPPEATRPVAAALAALVIFVPAYLPRFRADPFARVAREIAVSLAAVGALSGVA